MNAEFSVSLKLLDAVLNKWSSASAQAMFLLLDKGATRSELSDMLDISQPAVHERLAAADQLAVHAIVERYGHLVKTNLKR